jgi:nickel transport protein
VSAQTDRAAVSLSADELQALIEASLDKKLAPILHRLGDLAPGPSLSDILGGIGYIIGLVGLAAYLRSHRKSG